MRVPDEIKKCVVFLGYQLANGEFKFAGTALFLGNEVNGRQASYLVTARHVIDNIHKLGLDTIWAGLNKKGWGSRMASDEAVATPCKRPELRRGHLSWCAEPRRRSPDFAP
jgi:hypothetical protein